MNEREGEIAKEVEDWRERNYLYDREHRLDVVKGTFSAIGIIFTVVVLGRMAVKIAMLLGELFTK